MDPDVGESTADVLIEDGLITAVEPALSVGDAERIDVAGDVVMPGFVDTHRHTWQTPFRGLAADWCHSKYIRAIRLAVAPNCEPGDLYAGNYLGAVEALDAGVTTVLDFSLHQDTRARGRRAARTEGRGAPSDLRTSWLPGPS